MSFCYPLQHTAHNTVIVCIIYLYLCTNMLARTHKSTTCNIYAQVCARVWVCVCVESEWVCTRGVDLKINASHNQAGDCRTQAHKHSHACVDWKFQCIIWSTKPPLCVKDYWKPSVAVASSLLRSLRRVAGASAAFAA